MSEVTEQDRHEDGPSEGPAASELSGPRDVPSPAVDTTASDDLVAGADGTDVGGVSSADGSGAGPPGAGQPALDPPGEPSPPSAARNRYRIVAHDGARVLTSGNAPNITVRIVPGLSVDDRGRKRVGPQTIFLDGVYTGPPFCDNEARHYSFDHHAGCVRGFTLATCEQAAVMLLAGLPLSTGSWTLFVNDPDLDSLLAVWVLLNHVELLLDERALLRRAMPLIRLEGVIDAHGTDREILSALPEELHGRVRSQIDGLMEEERRLKAGREWMRADWIAYAQRTLAKMDAELLPEKALEDLLEIQEEGRAVLAAGRIAVLLESSLGIYAVEERLKERYGAALGTIVLRIDVNRYTLRLVDAFLPKNLEAVYKVLNRTDPRARTGGSNPNVWGGSADIGGSPREGGSGLGGEEVLSVLADVLGPPVPWWARIYRFFFPKSRRIPRALPPGT